MKIVKESLNEMRLKGPKKEEVIEKIKIMAQKDPNKALNKSLKYNFNNIAWKILEHYINEISTNYAFASAFIANNYEMCYYLLDNYAREDSIAGKNNLTYHSALRIATAPYKGHKGKNLVKYILNNYSKYIDQDIIEDIKIDRRLAGYYDIANILD